MNKLFTILVALLIICVSIITTQSFKAQNLRRDLEINKSDLLKKDKQMRLHIDSLRLVEKHLAKMDSLWSGIVKDQLNLLIVEREKTRIISIRYEKLKNTPVVRYNESQLDSVVSAIIQRRQP